MMEDNGEEYKRVSFERPTENGFDTVVFELPSYEIVEQEGNYSEEEIKNLERQLKKVLIYSLNMQEKEDLNLPSSLKIIL